MGYCWDEHNNVGPPKPIYHHFFFFFFFLNVRDFSHLAYIIEEEHPISRDDYENQRSNRDEPRTYSSPCQLSRSSVLKQSNPTHTTTHTG